ncbi:Uncharacterised protein [Shigella sonnei]|nr:Uncharacterised protein [Shigella sonnei]
MLGITHPLGNKFRDRHMLIFKHGGDLWVTHPFRHNFDHQRPLPKGFMGERDNRLDHIVNKMNPFNRFPETSQRPLLVL